MRQRVIAFYEKYNPKKLEDMDSVNKVLKNYEGKEKELFKKLNKAYAKQIKAEKQKEKELEKQRQKEKELEKQRQKEKDDGDKNEQTEVKPEKSLTEKLTAYYTKYNPDKVATAEQTAKKYKGKEKVLEKALKKKYGAGFEDV